MTLASGLAKSPGALRPTALRREHLRYTGQSGVGRAAQLRMEPHERAPLVLLSRDKAEVLM